MGETFNGHILKYELTEDSVVSLFAGVDISELDDKKFFSMLQKRAKFQMANFVFVNELEDLFDMVAEQIGLTNFHTFTPDQKRHIFDWNGDNDTKISSFSHKTQISDNAMRFYHVNIGKPWKGIKNLQYKGQVIPTYEDLVDTIHTNQELVTALGQIFIQQCMKHSEKKAKKVVQSYYEESLEKLRG